MHGDDQAVEAVSVARALCAAVFEPLSAVDPNLPARCKSYVEDGADAAVLGTLHIEFERACAAFGFSTAWNAPVRTTRNAFYTRAADLPPDQFARFARLIAEVVQTAHEKLGQSFGMFTWAAILIADSAGLDVVGISHSAPLPRAALQLGVVQNALIAEGKSGEDPIGLVFHGLSATDLKNAIRSAIDYSAAIVRSAELVKAALTSAEVWTQYSAFNEMLGQPADVRTVFGQEIAEALISKSARIANVAASASAGIESTLQTHLRRITASGVPGDQIRARAWLWRFLHYRPEAACALDDSERTRARSKLVALSAESLSLLRSACEIGRDADTLRRSQYGPGGESPITSAKIDWLIRFIQDPACTRPLGALSHTIVPDVSERHWAAFVQAPDVSPEHVVRLFVAFDYLTTPMSLQLYDVFLRALRLMRERLSFLTLREVEFLVREYGVPARAVALAYADGRVIAIDDLAWPGDAVWPFFRRYPELFAANCDPPTESFFHTMERMLAVVPMFPELPVSIADHVMGIALGTPEKWRRAAQASLADWPGKYSRIIAAISSGDVRVRSAAATWLADLGEKNAVPALKDRLKFEKDSRAVSAIGSALERLENCG